MERMQTSSPSVIFLPFPISISTNGVFQFGGDTRYPNPDFEDAYAVFEKIVKGETADIVIMFLDYIAETKFEHMKLYTEICLEVLIKTRNYELLCSRFIQFVVEGSLQNPNVVPVFLNKLLSLFEESNLLDEFESQFFFHLFKLAETETTPFRFEH